LLVRAMRENVLPWSEIVRLPFMTPGENMMTVSGIGREIIEALPEVEQASGVWCASYFSGMPWMDCAQNGAAVVISGVGDKAPGLKAAKKLADKVWSLRKDICFQGISMMPQEGLAYLDTSGEYPSILSDSADNVTAGSAGDNIYMLQMVLEAKTRGVLIAGLIDAPAVQCCAAKKPGCILSQLSLGGTLDASGSRRMTVEAKVIRSFCDASGRPKWAVISVEGIDVLLFADREPVRSEAELRAYGLNPYAYRIIVVKQGYIYPDLQRMCKLHVMALTPGNSAQDLTLLHYHKIRWPMEPIEDVTDLSRIAEVYGD
ncbi:MAG: MlrC C-terminal domain-containing protein, partial [Oscillospiraceae bacterium]